MFGLFGDRTEREARQLNRDAPNIVEHTYQSFRPKLIRDVALMTSEHITRAHETYGVTEVDLKRAHIDYKALHQEAQRRRDQVALSAMTLIIIYLRAEITGAAARPACQAIDGFIAEWAHAAPENDGSEPRPEVRDDK